MPYQKIRAIPACFFLIFILTAICRISYSQEPPPPLAKGQPRSENSQNRAKHQVSSGTNKNPSQPTLPVIIDKINCTKNDTSIQHTAKSKGNSKTDSKWNASDIFNLLMVVFTGFLVVCNILLWKTNKKSIEAAKKAADAAQKTADAVIGVEIPRFIIASMDISHRYQGVFVNVNLSNRGRTEAVIVRECLVCKESPELPPKPRYPISCVNKIDFGTIIEPGETREIEQKVFISDPPTSRIFWAYGYIRYRDFLGKIHRFGFAGGTVSHMGLKEGDCFGLKEEAPPAYTYCEYEKD